MTLPILYSFRRCPYAMRGRLGLFAAQTRFEWREILLRDKPAHMLEISPKGTVPVLLLPNGTVIDESLDLLLWSLTQNDPENWLTGHDTTLIAENDGAFKSALDRYKYPPRYPDANPIEEQTKASNFIKTLEARLTDQSYLSGATFGVTDAAIVPFIRQFAHVDKTWFWAQNWPHVIRWLDDFIASDRFRAIMVKLPPWDGKTVIHPDMTTAPAT